MEYKIVSIDSFPVIGVELITSLTNETDFGEIPKFWEKVLCDRMIEIIPNRKKPGEILGLSANFREDGTFSYFICAEVSDKGDVPKGMVCVSIPAADYAVFTARGPMPKSIQEMTRYIYREWLPHSEFERAPTAEFELYDERCEHGEDAQVDIYIPVLRS